MVGVKKVFLILAALCLWQQAAWAGPREEAAAAMARCDTIRDNAAWLDCHEKATAQMRAALAASPSGPVPPAQAATARFGADDLPARPRANVPAPKKLTARVESVSFSNGGYFTRLQMAGRDLGSLYQLRPEYLDEGVPSHWTPYVRVDDVDQAATRAVALNGEVIGQPFDGAGVARIALILDAVGARVGLWQPLQPTKERA